MAPCLAALVVRTIIGTQKGESVSDKLDQEEIKKIMDKRTVVMNEQDNLFDHWMFLTGKNIKACLSWYTTKNDVFDGMPPRDFVEAGYGWKVMNFLTENRSRQSFDNGFDHGVARGRKEIIEELKKDGIPCNITH
jgi:hypothetical protein